MKKLLLLSLLLPQLVLCSSEAIVVSVKPSLINYFFVSSKKEVIKTLTALLAVVGVGYLVTRPYVWSVQEKERCGLEKERALHKKQLEIMQQVWGSSYDLILKLKEQNADLTKKVLYFENWLAKLSLKKSEKGEAVPFQSCFHVSTAPSALGARATSRSSSTTSLIVRDENDEEQRQQGSAITERVYRSCQN